MAKEPKCATKRAARRRKERNSIQQAVLDRPGKQPELNAAAYLEIGTQLANRENWEDAMLAFARAVQLAPEHAPAYNNLGLALYKQKKYSTAVDILCKAIELRPAYPQAYNNLGLALLDDGRLESAVDCLRKAYELEPVSARICGNLALALEITGKSIEAEKMYRQAMVCEADDLEIHYNFGLFLKAANRVQEAQAELAFVVEKYPHYQQAEFALSSLYLLQGNYQQGWESYDRQRLFRQTSRCAGLPRWRGEDLQEHSIVLFYEQGFGDSLQFLRYARLVAAQAASTALWVQPELADLVAASFPEMPVISALPIKAENVEAERVQYDFACPFPSLPAVFATDENTIPVEIPYLQPPAALKAAWQEYFTAFNKEGCRHRKIGLVWSGNSEHHNDRNRSIDFIEFTALMKVSTQAADGISWFSLQKGEQAANVAKAGGQVIDLSAKLTDFAQTAAVIVNLDLVISVDSAVAHLAAALGKPVWVALPFAPDWRWQLERNDSPWYPTLRLFRQQCPGDWQMVLNEIAAALGKN